MKLHLPLGLLAALAATWLAPTRVGGAEEPVKKKFTDAKTFEKEDWIPVSTGNYELDLGLTLTGDNSWVISFKVPRGTTSSLGSQVSGGMPKELKGREGDFYFYFDPFSNGGLIYLGGFGWLTNNPDLNFQINAANGQFSMSSDRFEVVNNPAGALPDFPTTDTAKPRFMTHGGMGKGLYNYTGGPDSAGWDTAPSITKLYANDFNNGEECRFNVQLTYMVELTQDESVYTLAGAGELGKYKEGGKGTGLLSTFGESSGVLNEDKGEDVDSMYGGGSDGTKKLRFVAAGEKTKKGESDGAEYQEITTGKGGAVTAGELKMSGVIVEEKATEYTLSSSGTVTWGTGTRFEIRENFKIAASDGFVWQGDATMEVGKDKVLTMEGTGTGSAGILMKGAGTVVISDASTLGEGDVVLDRDDEQLEGGITLDLGGQDFKNGITINHAGNLARAGNKTAGAVTLNQIQEDIDLGGLRADLIQKVSPFQSGDLIQSFHVKNIGAGKLDLRSSLTLTPSFQLDGSFFSESANEAGKHYMFEFASPDEGVVSLGDGGEGNKMKFGLSDSVLKQYGEYEGTAYFWFTNGKLDGIGQNPEDKTEWFDEHFEFSIEGDSIRFFVEGSENTKDHGKVKILISNKKVWYSSVHGEGSDLLNRTDLIGDERWQQIVIDQDTTINIGSNLEDELTLKKLRTDNEGLSGKLTVKNDTLKEKRLVLKYDQSNGPDGYFFANDIEIQGKTSLVKDGEGKLTVTGNLNGSELEVAAGELALAGKQNKAKRLALQDGATLGLNGGTLTLEGAESETNLNAGRLKGSGTIELNDTQMKVAGEVIDENNRLVILAQGSKSKFEITGGDVSLAGIEGAPNTDEEEGGTINLGGNLTITGNGILHNFEGNLDATGARTMTVKGDEAGQTITSAGNGSIAIKILEGACVELCGAGPVDELTHTKQATYGSLVVDGKSSLYVNAPGVGADEAAGTQIHTTGDAEFQSGSYTEFRYNFAGVGDQLQSELPVQPLVKSDGNITIGKDARFTLSNMGSMFNVSNAGDLNELVLMEGKSITYEGEGESLTVLFEQRGAFLVYYTDLKVSLKDNQVVLSAKSQDINVFSIPAKGKQNPQAGADLLWAARFSPVAVDTDSTLYKTMDSIAYAMSGDPRGAARTLAAVAGSTAPVLGTAQRDALRAQMMRMRDHAGMMGLSNDYAYEELPYTHFWMEATGDFANVQDGGDYEPGYTYNAWGGTVGLELDVNETASVAAGVTALYGNLDGGCADTVDGKLDSYYLSLMGRFTGKRWGHNMVGILGLSQARLNRTVNYGAGSYSTHGNTSGWVAGLLYETTYDIPLNEGKTRVIQPLLGASIMKTSMDGYNETGQEGQGVGLNVGDQDWLTATLAMGARYIAAVGEETFNRTSQAEMRVNIAQDFGDKQGEADVMLQADPKMVRHVRAAEIGRTALQLGASLRVPVSDRSLIYFNVGADIRSGMTSWNLGAGTRYDF